MINTCQGFGVEHIVHISPETSVLCLAPFAHLLGLFPLQAFLQDLTGPGQKQTARSPRGGSLGYVACFVILHIALSVWSLTEAHLRGRAGLLPTRNGSRKQLATRLADEDITT